MKVVLVKSKCASVGFNDVRSKCQKKNVRFWEGIRLLFSGISHCDRDAPVVKGHLSTIAHFLGVI